VLDDVDLPMELGAAIAGTIRRTDNGTPTDAAITLYDSQYHALWTGFSAGGVYTTEAWQPGTYYVQAIGYDCAFYEGRPCPDDGNPASIDPTPITLATGDVREGTDFALRPGDGIYADGLDGGITPAARGTRNP
jgi:hypothetical protein